MLCQLVCTDRRYARMNCFNIRELQGILKRRFFVDLVNSHDHRHLLNTTMVGTKFKSHLNDNINQDITLFYNMGLHNTRSNKFFSFYSLSSPSADGIGVWNNFFLSNLYFISSNSTFSTYLHFVLNSVTFFFIKFYQTVSFFLFSSFSFLYDFFNGNLFQSILNTIFINFSFFIFPNFNTFYNVIYPTHRETGSSSTVFSSDELYVSSSGNLFSFTEASSTPRFNRFSSVLVNYDYKTGHYIGTWDSLYPQLILSFIEVARGMRKSSWVFSEQYTDLLSQIYSSYFSNFTGKINLKLLNNEG